MTTPNPLAKTKGAGTTFWMYTGRGDPFANPLQDTDWLRLAMVKDLQPGEMTADAEDDTYLDDEDADWKTTTQGQKSVGDTSATLAWRPGDSGQKKLVQLFDSGEVCAFRIKYPNGTVDVFRGWLSSLGKTIASKDVMTRTVKISGVGRPYLAEEGTETVGVSRSWHPWLAENIHRSADMASTSGGGHHDCKGKEYQSSVALHEATYVAICCRRCHVPASSPPESSRRT